MLCVALPQAPPPMWPTMATTVLVEGIKLLPIQGMMKYVVKAPYWLDEKLGITNDLPPFKKVLIWILPGLLAWKPVPLTLIAAG